MHIASSYYHDVEPCLKAKIPVIWVNRHKRELESGAEEADGRGQDAARGGEAARRCSRVRAVGLHPDVLVVTSRFWQTTCTIVRNGDEAFVIDSPRAARRARGPAGDRRAGGLPRRRPARHARRLGPPARPLRVPRRAARRAPRRPRRGCATSPARRSASCATSTTSTTSSGPAPLAIGASQALPVPGYLDLGERGARAASRRRPHARTAWRSGCRGRRCSSPATTCRRSRSRGSPRAGRATPTSRRCAGCEPLVEQADHVVPGPRRGARPRRARWRSCARTAPTSRRCWRGDAPLPLARRTGAQRKIHASNVKMIAG